MIKKKYILNQLQPYQDIIYFIVVLLVAHFFWKISFISNEKETVITFYGLDFSSFFNYTSSNVAKVVHFILNSLGYNTLLFSNNVIMHQESQHYAHVVWGCTSIKQTYIFICLIAFYRGNWKNKLWYIPLGILLIYFFNIFRIAFIIGVIDERPELFAFLHEHIMKYLFYLFIFGLWAFWNEVFTKKKN